MLYRYIYIIDYIYSHDCHINSRINSHAFMIDDDEPLDDLSIMSLNWAYFQTNPCEVRCTKSVNHWTYIFTLGMGTFCFCFMVLIPFHHTGTSYF